MASPRSEDLAECLAERRRLTRQQVRGTFGDGHLAAEASHGLRHLHADRPPAEHEQMARDGLHPGHLAVRPHPVELA